MYLEAVEKLAHKTIFEGFVAVVRSKNASPTWSDVSTALLDFDRAGLRGLVQDPIADYKKAIGRPEGMAELSIFYCEEAFGFLESCSMEDENYFAALIRMYGWSLEIVSSLPPAERTSYLERLDKLRSRGRNVGWAVEEEFNSLWYDAVDEQQSE